MNDSQVGYWEPAKWVAGIRRVNTGDSPVLLRVNMGSGHGGNSGRYGWLADTAEKYAFILEQAVSGSRLPVLTGAVPSRGLRLVHGVVGLFQKRTGFVPCFCLGDTQ